MLNFYKMLFFVSFLHFFLVGSNNCCTFAPKFALCARVYVRVHAFKIEVVLVAFCAIYNNELMFDLDIFIR